MILILSICYMQITIYKPIKFILRQIVLKKRCQNHRNITEHSNIRSVHEYLSKFCVPQQQDCSQLNICLNYRMCALTIHKYLPYSHALKCMYLYPKIACFEDYFKKKSFSNISTWTYIRKTSTPTKYRVENQLSWSICSHINIVIIFLIECQK